MDVKQMRSFSLFTGNAIWQSGDHQQKWYLHSSEHFAVWNLSIELNCLDECLTGAQCLSAGLRSNHSIGFNGQSCALRHISNHSWPWRRPSARSSKIHRRDASKRFQSHCTYRSIVESIVELWCLIVSIGHTNITVESMVSVTSLAFKDLYWPSMILGQIQRIHHALQIYQVIISCLFLSEQYHRLLFSRKRTQMAIQGNGSVVEIIRETSCRCIEIQSNVSVHGSSEKSSQSFSASDWLLLDTHRRYTSTDDRNQVDRSYSVLIPFDSLVYRCLIPITCAPDAEFQRVNSITQVSLTSICIDECASIESIQWRVFSGSHVPATDLIQWTLFNQTDDYENIWFFGNSTCARVYRQGHSSSLGTRTSKFTALNQLFLDNPHIDYWQFQVVYQFPSSRSVSELHLIINQPPQNGSCAISPLNGTTDTSFTVVCSDWVDDNDVKDYSLYGTT